MPIDPKYAAYLKPSAERSDTHPIVEKQEVGESFVGVVTFVGDMFEKKNNLYTPAVHSSDGQLMKEEQGKPTVTTMKVNIILKQITLMGEKQEMNEPRTVWIGKWGQFKSIGEACAEAGISDLYPGVTWGMARVKGEKGSNAHVFKSRIILPE